MSTRFLADFIARVEALKLDVDAVMVYQGGELVDAHRWSPDVPTDIYSHTKGFTSSAIGIAISEGLLSLEDRLVDHFPDHLPAHPAPLLGEIRLRHLLTMSSGFNAALLMLDQRRGPGAPDDYVRYMLAQPVPVQPGAAFHYSSADSYLAGCMLENRAGMTLRDYVYARILQPLDIPYPEWEHCPHGHTFGGGGMSLRTADMAKLGQLYWTEEPGRGDRSCLGNGWPRPRANRSIRRPRKTAGNAATATNSGSILFPAPIGRTGSGANTRTFCPTGAP
jgi:CubicO group peptidase (beta-lactamase class C family)